jgi:hypothetical protein
MAALLAERDGVKISRVAIWYIRIGHNYKDIATAATPRSDDR